MTILRKNGQNLRAPIIGNSKSKTTSRPAAANDETARIAFSNREIVVTVVAAFVVCLAILKGIDYWAVQILFQKGN